MQNTTVISMKTFEKTRTEELFREARIAWVAKKAKRLRKKARKEHKTSLVSKIDLFLKKIV